MISSGNDHQLDYEFIDSFLQKQPEEISFKRKKFSLFWWRQYAININVIMSSINGSFYGNFEIHVNNSLNRDNQRSNKDKLPYFDDVIT